MQLNQSIMETREPKLTIHSGGCMVHTDLRIRKVKKHMMVKYHAMYLSQKLGDKLRQ